MNTPGTPSRRALFVLGMHRSGTSAAARVVNLLGAELGHDLVPPGPDNPGGFWEHAEAVRINDELLHRLGRTWYDMRDMPDGWTCTPHARSAVQRIGKLIDHDFAASGLCAVKDPRMCLTLPLWIEAFETRGFEVDCLFIVRDPREVVASLHRRNAWSRAALYLMWVQYLMEATAASEHGRRAMITYDQLLSNWRDSVTRVARGFGLRWPIAPEGEVAMAVERFLDPGHRHHQEAPFVVLEDDAIVPGLAGTLYQACLDIASGEGQWNAISGLHGFFRENARLYAAHVDQLLIERWGAEERAQAAEASLAEQASVTTVIRDTAQVVQEKLASAVRQLQDELSALSGETAARFERQREGIMAMEARMQRQHALLNTISLRLERASTGAAAETAAAIDARLRVEVQELQSALARSHATIAASDAKLRAEVQGMQSALARGNAAIAALTASTSWKLTAPLRWLSVHVLRRPPALEVSAGLEPVATDARGDSPPEKASARHAATSGDFPVESVPASAKERPIHRVRNPKAAELRLN